MKFNCSVDQAMSIIPDKLNMVQIMTAPDGSTPMSSYKKKNWGNNNAMYLYTMENGRKLIETWYEIDYKAKYYRYGLNARDLDFRLDPFCVRMEGNMHFISTDN